MNQRIPAPVANPEDGEVLLEIKDAAGNVTETFVLRMNTNAICRLEQALSDGIVQIERRLRINPSLQDLRALLFAGLLNRHPLVTLNDAGNLIDRIGMSAASVLLLKVFELGFPVAPKGEAAKATAGKGTGPGTGKGSSRIGRKRASGSPTSGS